MSGSSEKVFMAPRRCSRLQAAGAGVCL